MKTNFKKSKGYTLVEILVVISIMGFVMAAAVYVVNSARIKGRDAKRMADLEQIRKAIEIYYNENKAYPSTGGNWARSSAISGPAYTNWNTLKTLLGPYISALPNDPINTDRNTWTGGYAYMYRNSTTNPDIYDLIAYLEDGSNPNTCRNKCYTYYTYGTGPLPWCYACPGGWDNGGDGIYANH